MYSGKDMVSSNMRWATSEYKDRPTDDEPNLAPRRRESSSLPSYEDYPANAHSSSTDPFATHLAPKAPPADDDGEDQPQVYIGPPLDEDGHVLSDVNII